jgi:Tol biopolymer transport system component
MLRNEGLRSSTTIGVALLLAALVTALVLWEGRPAEAAFQGVNGKITFTRDPDDANNEIYMMDAVDTDLDGNGDNLKRLTNNGQVFDGDPTFAPNGTKLAFESFRDLNDNIYVMSASDTDLDGNGDNLKRLTKKTADDEEPAFSPSGTKIAFTSDRADPGDNYDIFVMKAKPEGRKNRPKNLTKNAAYDAEASFSPDGTKIVFTSERQDSDGDIYVMNSNGTGVTRLTSNEAFDADANFSPDGDQIVFRSGRNGTDFSEVYVMDAVDANNDGEGDNMINISNYATANDAFPAFSPDGTKIVFRSARTTGTGVDNPEGDYEVFAVNASDGSGLMQLTHNDVADNVPDWGPLP